MLTLFFIWTATEITLGYELDPDKEDGINTERTFKPRAWQIDFNATEETHHSLKSTIATWDAGFGSTWNSYDAIMFGRGRKGQQRPFHTGRILKDLVDSKGRSSLVDFAITDGKMYGMIVGYNTHPKFNNLGGKLQSMLGDN